MLAPADQLRAPFQSGDRISFFYRRKKTEGTIVRLNPKRAIIEAEDAQLSIPYERLFPRSGKCQERIQRLENIQAQAVSLFKEHGLKRWRFAFDYSTRRAGCCNYRDKKITLAIDLAATGKHQEIQDTLLHEIAHALVGKRHNHDDVWKARALAIGCSAERTHKLQFSTPRWSVTCENRCWNHTAQKRNPKLICKKCGSRLVYTPYRATTA